MMMTATTASENPINVFGGSGCLDRRLPIELAEEFVWSMELAQLIDMKYYVRT
jgi:hypothetical protein